LGSSCNNNLNFVSVLSASMNIYKTNGSVKVETDSGKNIGRITACIIKGTNIYYEVSYFFGGDYRKVELLEKEFKIIGDAEKTAIGFKKEI